MPVRALRRIRLLKFDLPRQKSESINAREGIKTDSIVLPLIFMVIWSESINAREGIKTLGELIIV